jgi:RsiW-degrading membrane proteinase PrsW (M82 family)
MSESNHQPAALRARLHVWRDELVLISGLLVFVGIVYALNSVFNTLLSGTNLLAAGVIIALVPAFIWLAFFYLQDRLEPEPKQFVLGMFVLGAVLAAAIGIPLVENVFRVSHWLYANTMTTLIGGILVVGFTQEFIKYATVRYTMYHSDEFDEVTDGIVYATAAGLGYATMLNIQFVVSNGGVDLGAGVIRMAVVALAQASFAGITGYFLGRAKFESEPIWWMPLGITLAAVMNGLFNWLRGRVVQSGVSLTGASVNPWLGLAFAAVVAFVTMGILVWLMRRAVQSAQAKSKQEKTMQTQKSSLGDRFAEITVVVVTVIALLAGWFYKSGVENRSVSFEVNGISGQAPAGWLQAQVQGDEVLHVTDISSGDFGTTYIVRKFPIAADAPFGQLSSLLTLKYGQQLTAFRVLDQQRVTVAGREAYEISYVFVESNPNLTHAQLPVVVRGVDTIFINGDQAAVVTYWAGEGSYELDLGRFHQFLKSLQF